MAEGKKKPKLMPEGRTCWDCGTSLSRYNTENYCAVCRRKRFLAGIESTKKIKPMGR